MYHVYILRSEIDNKSYVGYTSHKTERRLEQHNVGSNRWTKGHKPFKLVYYESFICKPDAILREKYFKTGVGKKLKRLILENY